MRKVWVDFGTTIHEGNYNSYMAYDGPENDLCEPFVFATPATLAADEMLEALEAFVVADDQVMSNTKWDYGDIKRFAHARDLVDRALAKARRESEEA